MSSADETGESSAGDRSTVELQKQLARVQRRVVELEQSTSYRLGGALVALVSSPSSVRLLPARVRDAWRQRGRRLPLPPKPDDSAQHKSRTVQASHLLAHYTDRPARSPHRPLVLGVLGPESTRWLGSMVDLVELDPSNAPSLASQVDADVLIISSDAAEYGGRWTGLGEPTGAAATRVVAALMRTARRASIPTLFLWVDPTWRRPGLVPVATEADFVVTQRPATADASFALAQSVGVIRSEVLPPDSSRDLSLVKLATGETGERFFAVRSDPGDLPPVRFGPLPTLASSRAEVYLRAQTVELDRVSLASGDTEVLTVALAGARPMLPAGGHTVDLPDPFARIALVAGESARGPLSEGEWRSVARWVVSERRLPEYELWALFDRMGLDRFGQPWSVAATVPAGCPTGFVEEWVRGQTLHPTVLAVPGDRRKEFKERLPIPVVSAPPTRSGEVIRAWVAVSIHPGSEVLGTEVLDAVVDRAFSPPVTDGWSNLTLAGVG